MKRRNIERTTAEQQSKQSNTNTYVSNTVTSIRLPHLWMIILMLVIILTSTWILYYNHLKTQENFKELKLHEQKRLMNEDLTKQMTIAAVKKYEADPESNDVVVLYAYFETVDSRINIVHFFRHALYASADFIFIINGESDVDQLLPSNTPNIRIVRRNNSCFDLGSHGEVLKDNDYEIAKKYKRYILLNGSVRGPFLPTYVEACWADLFLKKITNEVKLVGTTYNYWAKHAQSMVIATDTIGIKILLAGNETDTSYESDPQFSEVYQGNPNSLVGLSACPTSKFRAVSAEISLTNLIRRAGYKVAVLMTSATSVQIQGTCDNDIDDEINLSTNTYNLASVHPYEIIFIKARRGWEDSMDRHLLEKLTDFHNALNYSSWEACKRF